MRNLRSLMITGAHVCTVVPELLSMKSTSNTPGVDSSYELEFVFPKLVVLSLRDSNQNGISNAFVSTLAAVLAMRSTSSAHQTRIAELALFGCESQVQSGTAIRELAALVPRIVLDGAEFTLTPTPDGAAEEEYCTSNIEAVFGEWPVRLGSINAGLITGKSTVSQETEGSV